MFWCVRLCFGERLATGASRALCNMEMLANRAWWKSWDVNQAWEGD